MKKQTSSRKIAKRIRREIGYYPSDKRKYEVVNKRRTIEVAADDKRTLYKEMVKEEKQNARRQ